LWDGTFGIFVVGGVGQGDGDAGHEGYFTFFGGVGSGAFSGRWL
jgi:hypothetical protein